MDAKEQQAIDKILSTLEQFGKRFEFGLAPKGYSENERPWYSFTGLILQLLKVGAPASGDPIIRAICAGLYGNIQIFGLKETVKLTLQLRRNYQHANTSTKGSKP